MYHKVGKPHQHERYAGQLVHGGEQVAELRQHERYDNDNDRHREDSEYHRVHERGLDLLVHLVRLFVVGRQTFRDLIELAAALARADHAEHERREHALRLECGGQARALADLGEHIAVNAAQIAVQALILRDDSECAHKADTGSQQRRELTAQLRELLRLYHALFRRAALLGGILQIQPLREQLGV